ncbi:MAG TPA: hypothetical protein VKS01_04150 [Bryobacteraceae bacterium]|nr:hypothetical protein [Bryobacteraceae bacterium]
MKRVAAILLMVAPIFAADLEFTGSLERVGHDSLSLRLEDGRTIDARLAPANSLSSERVAGQYKLGDQVEIACREIPKVWEEETSRYQFLQLTRLKFLGEPSAAQLTEILKLEAGRKRVNLLSSPNLTVPAPSATPTETAPAMDAAAHAKLEHAREVNLERAAALPNFVADEIAKRFAGDARSSQWRAADTIQAEITFKGRDVTRQQIRRDGRKWDKPFEALPGYKWTGFGVEMKPLFDLQCPTAIDYEGPAEENGKRLDKYRFSSPADGCFIDFFMEYQRYNPARAGFFFIDDSANVVRIEEDALAFPAGFEFAHRREEISWDYVKIGAESHLLPVAANFVVSYASGSRWRVDVEYKNHRHFEAASNISYH